MINDEWGDRGHRNYLAHILKFPLRLMDSVILCKVIQQCLILNKHARTTFHLVVTEIQYYHTVVYGSQKKF
jgi:hypothetical protein